MNDVISFEDSAQQPTLISENSRTAANSPTAGGSLTTGTPDGNTAASDAAASRRVASPSRRPDSRPADEVVARDLPAPPAMSLRRGIDAISYAAPPASSPSASSPSASPASPVSADPLRAACQGVFRAAGDVVMVQVHRMGPDGRVTSVSYAAK